MNFTLGTAKTVIGQESRSIREEYGFLCNRRLYELFLEMSRAHLVIL